MYDNVRTLIKIMYQERFPEQRPCAKICTKRIRTKDKNSLWMRYGTVQEYSTGTAGTVERHNLSEGETTKLYYTLISSNLL